MQRALSLFYRITHLLLIHLLFLTSRWSVQSIIWNIKSCFNIVCKVYLNAFCFRLYRLYSCLYTYNIVLTFLYNLLSRNYTKTHTLLLSLLLILIYLNKKVYLWLSVYFNAMANKFSEKNCCPIIWFRF